MKRLVTENINDQVIVHENRIARTEDHLIITRPETKQWRVVYDKRLLLPDLTTLP
jgi:hypothetical protein